MRIDSCLSKNEILYLYLNQIYLGAGAYGVEAAARTYFDKHASELDLARSLPSGRTAQGPQPLFPDASFGEPARGSAMSCREWSMRTS